MAIRSKVALDQENLTIIVDRGYFRSEEILENYDAGLGHWYLKPILPIMLLKGILRKMILYILHRIMNIFAQQVCACAKPASVFMTIKSTTDIPVRNIRAVTLRLSVLQAKSAE